VSNYHYMKGEPDMAIRYGRQCLGLGEAVAQSPTGRAARQYLGTSYHALGEYGMAEEMLTEQIAALESSEDHSRLGPVNLAYVSSASWLAWTHLELGEFRRAHEAATRATRAATAAGHPYARAIASTFAGFAWHAQGDVERALPVFESSVHLCAEHQLEVWRPVAAALLGHASVAAGKVEDGVALLTEATALTERLGVQAYRALWITLLAEALLVHGQIARAVEVAERAIQLATQNREQGNHTRALVVLASASLHLGPRGLEQANEHLRHALEQAERLRMRPLVAWIYHVLGTLAGKEGDVARGQAFLDTARVQARQLGMWFWWERRPAD
jgi:tetratricopeptide (TPR) repeat protein